MSAKEVRIIKELLAADGAFVSGAQLAEALGVSRVAVWSHMEKMRQQGFDFEAVRSKGYRLAQLPENLNLALLLACLPTTARDLDIILLDEIDSTNSEAERLLANGHPDPFLVISRRQTGGRGRLGRQWHSPENGNLYASFAFRPAVSPARLSSFTLWMGLNLCECINAFARVSTQLKWPNDLLLDGKKLAGILTEARMDADSTRDLVLGIGLNVNSEAADWPADLRPLATSLKEATGRPININRLTAALAGRAMMAYQSFVAGDNRQELKSKWELYDALRDQTVSLWQGSTRITGVARGIDGSGSLQIERPDGSRLQVRAGEVTLEKNT